MTLKIRGRRTVAKILAWAMMLPSGLSPSAMTLPDGRSSFITRVNGRPVPSPLPPIAAPVHLKAFAAPGGDPPPPPPPPPPVNPIIPENLLAGNPQSEWDLDPSGSGGLSGDPTIQGFTTAFSVNRGTAVQFKIDTDATAYHLDIYRMGYYGGAGARKVATVLPTGPLPNPQPMCLSDEPTGLIDCGNWSVSATWNMPASAVSGIYFAKVVRNDTGGASHIFFVVRDDFGNADIVVQTSDTTWEAYNDYGGNSLYKGNPVGRAYKVSYNRPMNSRGDPDGGSQGFVFSAEYPMVRWLEANGYNVSYISGIDTDRDGPGLRTHRVFLSSGHDEYWSRAQRANVEAARDSAEHVHLAFFSGNEVFWKTRWENSIDGSNTPYRTLVSYKETHANGKIDPTSEWTGTWRDPRSFNPQGPSGTGVTRPENALSGTIFMVNGTRTDSIMVPAEFGSHRFWRHTSIALLHPGDVAILPTGTLGYEWDESPDNGFQPAGLERLSSTTIDVTPLYLQDYGSNYGVGTATHSLTLYRASSGALVFGAGTTQWAWGLDSNHDRGNEQPSLEMRQATVNLLADMGVTAASLQPNLNDGLEPPDTTRPTSSITSPPSPNATVHNGDAVVISGTASDDHALGSVEVSVNGGATWATANGLANWTFNWTATGSGVVTIMSRAYDDSGNVQAVPASVAVTVLRECPCSIWNDTVVPPVPSQGDDNAIELGMRFRADSSGIITGVRFYKGAGNTGIHTGTLWANDGTLLASAQFNNETALGWQQLQFNSPVHIQAGVTYVVSYHTSTGHYAIDRPIDTPVAGPGFTAAGGISNAPLRALHDGEDGPNGVYVYGAGSVFPSSTYGSTNYYVDPMFVADSSVDVTPPFVTAKTPLDAATGVTPFINVTARFSEILNPSTVNASTFQLRDSSGALISAIVSYQSATQTAILDPAPRLLDTTVYTATLLGGPSGVKDLAGNPLATDISWSFTTATPAVCPCTIWTPQTVPTFLINNATDGLATHGIELGVKFRADSDGLITGIRFFKSLANVAPHTATLWDMNGNALADVTFVGETASGWQQVDFATPVFVNANQTYIASYHTNVGRYSVNQTYFLPQFAQAQFTRAPLRAMVDGDDGPNGVYKYGGHAFPTDTFLQSNYWVDVVFTPSGTPADTTPPVATPTFPAPGATSVPPFSNITASFNEPVQTATVTGATVELRNTATGVLVPAAVTYDVPSRTVTLDPASKLADATQYTATLHGGATGIRDLAGNWLQTDVAWSFTTSGTIVCDRCTIWPASAAPTIVDNFDPNELPSLAAGGIELGVRFRADADGLITGIRFYKSIGNIDPHVGTLWDGNGTWIASATFTGETPSGWQEVSFSPAVPIQANHIYVASYHTTVGHYSIDRPYFTAANEPAFTRLPLHASIDSPGGPNGVFRYGIHDPALGAPTLTYQQTNYWVDVVFKTVGTANTAPTAVNDSFSINEDQTLTVAAPGVLGNDTDGEGDALGAILVTPPAHGALVLSGNGAFSYTPSADFNSTDTFTYKANDGLSDSPGAATVTITVNAVNDPPIFDAIANQTIDQDSGTHTVTITGVAPGPVTAVDEAGQTVVMTATSNNPALVPNPTIVGTHASRTLSYQPQPNAVGTAVITVVADDGQPANNTFTRLFTITVAVVAPTALTYSANPAMYTKGAAITPNTPSHTGGAVVSYAVSPALPAGLSLNTSTGVITGTPTVLAAAAGYTVTATNTGGSTPATVTITVIDVAPTALTYSTNPATYTKGIAITANTPSISGGPVVSYSVSPALPAGLSLNTTTGVISGTPTTLAPAAGYTVTATNTGGSTPATVTITVVDVAPVALTYSANPATYTKGTAITANTPSSTGGPVVSYSVSPALPAGLSLNTSTGVITGTPTVLAAAAGYTVTATNTGGSTPATVTITVVDVAPSALTYSANPATYTKGTAITANTPSISGGPVVSYAVSPALPAGLSLNTSTGVISGTPTTLAAAAGYTVTATNTGGSTPATVTITVIDVAPTALTYSTNPATYTKGIAITANTPSISGGPVVSYAVSPALPAGLSLNTTTGVISGTPTTLAAAAGYTVTATNTGGSTPATVTITVIDVAPTALTYSTNPATYTKGIAITANTPSISGGPVVSYSVSPALPAGLSLNTTTGVISGTPTTLAPAAGYTVTATNTGGSTPATVTITVVDVAPVALTYSANPATYTKGTAITANTPSSTGGPVVSYSVSPALPAGLSLNTSTGVITGTPTVLAAAAGYTVTATNTGGSTPATVTITVVDVAPSALTYSANPATYTKGTAITANTPSISGGPVVSYAVSPALPAGLSLNTATGIITGTPTVLAAAAGYTVTATNTGGSTPATVTITVVDVAPSALTYSANPATYTKGTAITANTPSISGGPVVSYAVSPALPAGLSLNTSTGVITGTPTVLAAAAGYTVTATNTGGSTPATVTITVVDVAPSALTYSANPATYTKGTAITANTPSSTGGAVVSYAVSPALPAGLSLNTATGVITGTPTALAPAAGYTVTATNTGGSTPATVTITVVDVAPSALTYSANPATYTKGTAITANTPSISGGPVVSYAVSPALPAGLSLNTATGVITGTPTVLAAAAGYTVTATNTGGSTPATVTITVVDVAPSALTYSANPATYTKGTAITANTPSHTGGAVVSYAVSPALPAGLSLNTATGVITGTPTVLAAAAGYTVTATNTGGSTPATVTITVVDVAPSALTYSANPATYTKGTAITANTPSSTGGPVVSYAVSPALPAGLSLNTATGVITGTPTVLAAAAGYTVTATNTGGSTPATVTITVVDVAPAALTYSTNPATYTKGTAITPNTPSHTGGAVVSYAVSPALPAGLSLNTATGVITGTPTVLAAAAGYTVTATNTGGSTPATVTITVVDVAPAALTYSANPATYTKGTAITANTPSSTGGAVVSYAVSPALPAGLSLNTATGVITGTPTVLAAAAGYTVTATNTGGSTPATVTITVIDVAPTALTYSANPATYTKGTAITANTPSSTGGPVVSYAVSPALPAGLSLNTATGVITGTPTVLAAAAGYTVTATNTGGSTPATVTITVVDVAPSALTYSANPATYTKGTAITANTPSSTGGAVVSYAVSPALPAGLSLNTATGVITGTPTVLAAAAGYTVTATNTGGSTTKTVTITVIDVAPTALTYAVNPATYALGTAITPNTPSNTGGAVVSYAVSPALPAGLSLSTTTGVISGTPTAATAAAGYTVTATNTGGSTPATVTITVVSATPTTTSTPTSSLNPSTYGQSVTFTATVTGSGGTPTGSLTFYDGATPLGTSTLVAGSASLATTAVQAGTRSITAAYSGDATFATSTSAALTQTVNKATTTTALTLTPIVKQYSDRDQMDATISVPGAATSVTFKIGTVDLGTAPVDATGKASLNPQLLGAIGSGVKVVTAQFNGISPNYTVGNPTKSLTVQREDTAPIVYTGPTTLVISGGMVTMTVPVVDINDGDRGDIGNANVAFINRGTSLTIGTATVIATGDHTTGTATLTWAATPGTYTIGFSVGNYYIRNNTADNVTITVTN